MPTSTLTANPIKVLVIEDDQEINELLGEYLALEQYTYAQALSGKSGVEDVHRLHPDALVLDLMLPDIDGYQVATDVSLHRDTFDVPIIMLTCMNQQCDRDKGIACGAFRFMNKPFLPDDLLANVRKGIEWSRSLRNRPPRGTIAITGSTPSAHLPGINEMIADLFVRTEVSDAAAAGIREGFQRFAEWVLDWGKKHNHAPRVLVEYELGKDAAGAMAIQWKLGEASNGMLHELLFKPQSPEADPFAAAWMLPGGQPAGSSPALAPWYEFLALTGASAMDRNGSSARLSRTFTLPLSSMVSEKTQPALATKEG